ncbi:Domain of uncharacterised function (DUF2825) [Klebsiella pneumoniae]|nr:Domain of uncharacterised function (DUF2825) [Klebsiella pneumoniae]
MIRRNTIAEAVYPRWRGEHFLPNHGARASRRFIPAGAGNTHPSTCRAGPAAVYPRWRGEHPPSPVSGCLCCGLSPLARGTHSPEYPQTSDRRFIPAGAGNTSSVASVITSRSGLSPLARGTRRLGIDGVAVARFIPAGAGNTQSGNVICTPASVYPRWRGEHCGKVNTLIGADGLSPLARGTRPAPAVRRRGGRFIPAGAGNTSWSWRMQKPWTVYPRWRGEHQAPI